MSSSGQNQQKSGGFAQFVRDHTLLVAAVAVLAVLAAGVYRVAAPSHYEAETDVLVSPVSSSDGTFTGLGLPTDPSGSVLSVARLLTTPLVTDTVRQQLELSQTNEELLARLTILPLQQSGLITIQARSPSPTEAASISNTMASVLINQRKAVFQQRLRATIGDLTQRLDALKGRRGVSDEIRGLQGRIGTLGGFVGQPDPTIEIWSSAVAPDKPVPVPLLGSVVAFLAALLLGAGAALLFVRLDPRLTTISRLPPTAPVVAKVRSIQPGALDAVSGGPGSTLDDISYAMRLVHSLATSDARLGRPRCVLVTSPDTSDAKTVVSIGIGRAYAALGHRVAMIEADVHDPRLAAALGAKTGSRGLLAVLAGGGRAMRALKRSTVHPRISVLGVEASTTELEIGSPQRVIEVVGELAADFDVVVIDAASAAHLADLLSFSVVADDILVVTTLGSTRMDALEDLLQTLEQFDAPVTGHVVVAAAHPVRAMRSRLRRVDPEPAEVSSVPAGTRRPANDDEPDWADTNGDLPESASDETRAGAQSMP